MANHPNRNRKPSRLDMTMLRFIEENRFFDAGDHTQCEMFPRHEHTIPRLLEFKLIELVDVGGVHVYHATSAGERLASKNA